MKKLLAVLLLAVFLFGCSQFQGNNSETDPVQQTTDPRTKAPDITLLDAEGKEVKLSDFEGKPVVLNFWASWCGPCKRELPDFQDAYDELKDQVHFLIVNLADGKTETVDSAKAFLEKESYHFPAYFDTMNSAYTMYGVTSIPTTFFISADGYVIAYGTGSMDKQTLMKGINMILPLYE